MRRLCAVRRRRCGQRVGIRPFGALGLSVQLVTWGFVAESLMLGEWHPRISPSISTAFPLLRVLRESMLESNAPHYLA